MTLPPEEKLDPLGYRVMMVTVAVCSSSDETYDALV